MLRSVIFSFHWPLVLAKLCGAVCPAAVLIFYRKIQASSLNLMPT